MKEKSIPENRMAFVLALAGGILILLAGFTGYGFWSMIKEIIITNITFLEPAIDILFYILLFFATLGGVTVIIGGGLIYKGSVRSGKFLIFLGTGFGLIGLIIAIIISIYKFKLELGLQFSLSGIGVILSIIARSLAKPVDRR